MSKTFYSACFVAALVFGAFAVACGWTFWRFDRLGDDRMALRWSVLTCVNLVAWLGMVYVVIEEPFGRRRSK